MNFSNSVLALMVSTAIMGVALATLYFAPHLILQTDVGEYLGNAVNVYCSAPAAQRSALRAAVATRAYPDYVEVHCAAARLSEIPAP